MTELSLDEAERIASRFLIDYADCLDTERYQDWPGYFDESNCRYEIRSRENEDLGLPAAIMYCDTHGMLTDRVTMLEKALTYRHLILRHFISNVRIVEHHVNKIKLHANYQLMQTDNDGVTTLFGVGQYKLVLTARGPHWRVAEMFVIVDSFGIDNMLAVPI
ncbi:MAG: aromatic-ring-hydroxylating dioxygenase subunit beta [Burkholderiaceae bacterium]